MIIPTTAQTIERMKREILALIKEGTIPASVSSFYDLADYVQADALGGFRDGLLGALMVSHGAYGVNRAEFETLGMPLATLNYIEDCNNAVDDWLTTGGHTQ